MAGPGITTAITGVRDDFGGTLFNVADHTGVASYVSGVAGGELLDPKSFGFFGFVFLFSSISVSGTYVCELQPLGVGNAVQWRCRWFTAATGAEVSNATNLSAEKVKIMALGL